ncbi:pyridine nucleotide-disulfide oxidoreductase/dicluster-binding protein [Desulforamulus hydrothermalis]|uniref:Amine oxidase n=1 Tax=Desulforamulus hydrothermalis Lam5 = DSM 18033 TaxID=1121428 RepID=K8E0V6_9FIRM|nr:pyridine nucleotide-disulfide oxidoreductase/dicluster-binding protein [Desulforamulus hydrothermalis]CCO09200.1 Amine oxidase [Desulforamulus hydrothermalis Lam5 = DSM 18033]SHH10800.1 aldehyde dehydrogenase, iron-sulfur subunit [Desulforamulus hydrothermalis Lam5 = DSM 18033]
MDHKRIFEFEEKCIQEHPPACTAACPVHVDVKGFIREIKAGRFDEALNIYSKSVPFPGIIGRICDHPCQAACKRKEVGDAIAIAALEKACVQLVQASPPKVTAPSGKKQRVAVIGGGLSSLTVAFDLAKKGYRVTLFEAGSRLGGSIWEIPEVDLPPQVIDNDLAVLNNLGVIIHFNTRVGKDISFISVCDDYQAIYLGTGNAVWEFNLPLDEQGNLIIDPVTFAAGRQGIFAGGTLRSGGTYSPITSLSDGRRAAISIDRYLQGVSLTAARENEGPYLTRLFSSTKGVKPLPAVPMGNGRSFYSKHEAMQEAARCLQCQCLECVKVCQYMIHFKGYPKKFIRQINHNLKMIKGRHEANILINSCSLCGLCQQVCPEGLNLGELCQEARAEMVKKGKMPPSAHDFPIRDMEFSNGEQCVLSRHQPGHTSSSYLFFPGCQLSASAPEHVERSYAYLTERLTGGVGLMLRCCGAPAAWSGRTELFLAELQKIKDQWREMGRPRLILACSTCYQMFKKHLPDVEIISLWELYDQYGLPKVNSAHRPALVAVHDACTTRHERHVQETVRKILHQIGCRIEELPTSCDKTACCGFGGLLQFANRGLADEVMRRRINESSADYVAYCAICRDNFAAKGKKTYHLLDLIYGEADAAAPAKRGPGYSQRRENRVRLKNKMLKEVWGERVAAEKMSFEAINLIIPAAVNEVMEERLILVEDVQKVIEYAERTGNKLLIRNNGHVLACHRPVAITYWVEYTPQEDGFTIHNAYSHRMEVKGNH